MGNPCKVILALQGCCGQSCAVICEMSLKWNSVVDQPRTIYTIRNL